MAVVVSSAFRKSLKELRETSECAELPLSHSHPNFLLLFASWSVSSRTRRSNQILDPLLSAGFGAFECRPLSFLIFFPFFKVPFFYYYLCLIFFLFFKCRFLFFSFLSASLGAQAPVLPLKCQFWDLSAGFCRKKDENNYNEKKINISRRGSPSRALNIAKVTFPKF